MSMSEVDVQRQINQMIAFIEQEASEKVEEIDAKADEEFNIEKGKLVQQQRVKIMEFYERKEKQIELQRKIQNSSLQNQARLRVLKTQEDFVLTTIENAKKRLSQISGDVEKYRQVLQLLLLQALEQLLEPDVLIICRKKDVSVVQGMVDPCVSAYRKATKREIKVEIDRERHLPDDVAGGIELHSRDGRTRLVNTLESRLDMVAQLKLPEIRCALFGRNLNRKFDN